jgi:hypothetical protein
LNNLTNMCDSCGDHCTTCSIFEWVHIYVNDTDSLYDQVSTDCPAHATRCTTCESASYIVWDDRSFCVLESECVTANKMHILRDQFDHTVKACGKFTLPNNLDCENTTTHSYDKWTKQCVAIALCVDTSVPVAGHITTVSTATKCLSLWDMTDKNCYELTVDDALCSSSNCASGSKCIYGSPEQTATPTTYAYYCETCATGNTRKLDYTCSANLTCETNATSTNNVCACDTNSIYSNASPLAPTCTLCTGTNVATCESDATIITCEAIYILTDGTSCVALGSEVCPIECATCGIVTGVGKYCTSCPSNYGLNYVTGRCIPCQSGHECTISA